MLSIVTGPPAGRRCALYDGGHRSVAVFPVLPAKPVVPGAPAPSGGGTGPLELPDAVRPGQDPQRQPCPGAPVSPEHFHPVFAEVLAELEGSGGLEAFRQLDGHVLIALDGTEYHVSSKVHCQQCSTRKRDKDKTEHFHALVSATVVAPEHNRVVPLEPEFIVPQDGHEKQDCESRAAGWSATPG